MAKKIAKQRKQKRKPAPAAQRRHRPERRRKSPPFNRDNPNAWLDHITENLPPFIRSVCKSVYHESLLVRLPEQPLLCAFEMTSRGHVDTKSAKDFIMLNLDQERVAQYRALVRQEDPEERLPSAHVFAAFSYTRGHVPQVSVADDGWRVMHLYAGAPAFDNGVAFDAMADPKHYTQSACLVAVHPVVQHLMAQYPCIVYALRARSFTQFQYDPANYFAPQAQHDDCGFVV